MTGRATLKEEAPPELAGGWERGEVVKDLGCGVASLVWQRQEDLLTSRPAWTIEGDYTKKPCLRKKEKKRKRPQAVGDNITAPIKK